jgi:hypothetical protein
MVLRSVRSVARQVKYARAGLTDVMERNSFERWVESGRSERMQLHWKALECCVLERIPDTERKWMQPSTAHEEDSHACAVAAAVAAAVVAIGQRLSRE